VRSQKASMNNNFIKMLMMLMMLVLVVVMCSEGVFGAIEIEPSFGRLTSRTSMSSKYNAYIYNRHASAVCVA
jgi:hypothetical protein